MWQIHLVQRVSPFEIAKRTPRKGGIGAETADLATRPQPYLDRNLCGSVCRSADRSSAAEAANGGAEKTVKPFRQQCPGGEIDARDRSG